MRYFCGLIIIMLFVNVAIAELSAEKQKVISSIDAKRLVYSDMAQQIWKWAELEFEEFRSSALLQDTLKKEGFEVESGVAGMPTAFIASFGDGKPIIGLLAEFDALPGMSQDICAEQKPLVEFDNLSYLPLQTILNITYTRNAHILKFKYLLS